MGNIKRIIGSDTGEALIAENAIWSTQFLNNIFALLKETEFQFLFKNNLYTKQLTIVRTLTSGSYFATFW